MFNKKCIAKTLVVSILLINTPIETLAGTIQDYNFEIIDKVNDNSFKENNLRLYADNLFNKIIKNKKNIKINKNINIGTVKDVALGDNDFIPNLDGNPDGFETIRVTTTGNKKLTEEDYDNLRTSGIPKIDLSNAFADTITEYAFSSASHITEFKFPKGLQSIDRNAFFDCTGLTGDLIIPDTVNSIEKAAFYGCTGFTGNLVLPEGLTSIGKSAFENCSGLTGNLIIPNSVTSLGASAFSSCEGFTGDLIIPPSITVLEGSVFSSCRGFDGELILPDTLTSIGSYSLSKLSGLKGELNIPASVTSLGDNAFSYSGFTGELVIPKSITSLPMSVFEKCEGFTGDLIIPDSITEIGNSAFQDCTGFNGKLVIPDSVTFIDEYAFMRCSGLTGDLVIPNSITTIEDQVFVGAGFTGNLILPDTITSIGYAAFSGCDRFTGDLIIPDSVEYIEDSAFNNCSSFNGILKLPKNITAIDNSTFSNCRNLTGELVIPESVTEIGLSAFKNCSGFTGDLVIPNSIVKIRSEAFAGCFGFNGTLTLSNQLTNLENAVFKGCSNFTGDVLIPESLELIGDDVFTDCTNIKKVAIRVNSNDIGTDYKTSIIYRLPDSHQTVIDLPYDFTVEGTWIEYTKRLIGKPTLKNNLGGAEIDIIDNRGANVALYVYAPHRSEDISVLKDGSPYPLPAKNKNDRYLFTEIGTYQVTITTILGNTSVVEFEVEGSPFGYVDEAVEKAEETKNTDDIEYARDIVNGLPESIQKDDYQNRLDNIYPSDISSHLSPINKTSKFDVFVTSSNSLSLSLNTSSVTFNDFDGVDNSELLNAINMTINSSLPYEINAYLVNEIEGSKGSVMDKRILNIRLNGKKDYQVFPSIETPIVLSESEVPGDDKNHGIDLMLKGGIHYEIDSYKATVRLEVKQK